METRARLRGPVGSNSCLGGLWPVSQGLQGRSCALCHSGPCPRARMCDQLSWATRTGVQGPAESTSCPVRHRPVNEGCQVDTLSLATRARVEFPRGQPAVPDDSCPLPTARGVNMLSCAHWARVRWLVGRPAELDDSGSGPRSRGNDQLSRLTCDKVACPRCPPPVPGHSGP